MNLNNEITEDWKNDRRNRDGMDLEIEIKEELCKERKHKISCRKNEGNC